MAHSSRGGQRVILAPLDDFGLKQIAAQDVDHDLRRIADLLLQQGELRGVAGGFERLFHQQRLVEDRSGLRQRHRIVAHQHGGVV